MSKQSLAILLVLACVAIFFLFRHSLTTLDSTAGTILTISLCFFFVAVASYIVGMLGGSYLPSSGMGLCAMIVAGGLFLLLGIKGQVAVFATLTVAVMVTTAASSAADLSQDLKTGYLVGASPKAQQWMNVLAAVVSVIVMAPVINVLNRAYGIGTGAENALKAPQATLLAQVSKSLFESGNLEWAFIIAGAAVGMFLPLTTSAAILAGGIISVLVKDVSKTGKGTLFASGLIAGEAIMAIFLAVFTHIYKGIFPIQFLNSPILSCLCFLALAVALYLIAKPKVVSN